MKAPGCRGLNLVLNFLLLASATVSAEPLWRIGAADNNNRDFLFAPASYSRATGDALFVIGESDPAKEWPYAQPGPHDAWGGSRSHTYSILFGLASTPARGTCTLRLDFLDTQRSSPPRLVVRINGQDFAKQLPAGAGDASIFGQPAQGREAIWEISFPPTLLRQGANEVQIQTREGSWALYDAISLSTPAGARLTTLEAATQIAAVEVPPVWRKLGGVAKQPITLEIRHLGPARAVDLVLGKERLGSVALQQGLHRTNLLVTVPRQSRTERLRLVSNGKELASRTLSLSAPPIREMWLIPHSHVDIGYTHRQDEIVQVQISNLETAMRLAKATATNPPSMRFKWNPEAVWTLDHFLQRATPEARQEFLDCVRRGEVGVDGLYGNLLTGLCRPEELAQGLAFGARLSNLTGVPVESASICDVPGWTWGMVPIMAGAGVKYFAIGPNYGDRVGTIHTWDNRPFYWKSQSGRERVLCWVVDNYHFYGDLESHVLAQVSKLQDKRFPYDTSFMFWVGRAASGSVDNAPPDEEITQKALKWNEQYAAPRIVIGLAGEYFREFERRHGRRLPEYSGDLTPYWEDGAGSTSRETGLNRASADRLSQAETLYALRAPAEYPRDRFDAAWKNVLLYSEHTWGAWCSISKPDDAFTLDQWKVKQAFALDADRQSRELMESALRPAETGDNTSGVALEVFNTTQWPRTDVATIPPGLTGGAVVDASGQPVVSQRLTSGELVYLTGEVPPFASRSYRLLPQSGSAAPPSAAAARATQFGLENGLIRLEVDPVSGGIRSLRMKGSAHEFVDHSAPVGLNDFRYVLGTNAAAPLTNGMVRVRVVDNGPLVASLRIESEAPGCEKLTRDIRLVCGLDRVEISNSVDRKSVREKDSVHFGFGFHVPAGQIHMETPWAVVRPNLDQLPGSCRNWFTVQRWLEIANGEVGVTWAPLDAPLVQIGGMTANLLGSVRWDEWMTNAIDSQTIYSWAQNNHWHTNYKIDQPGVTTFRFMLRPHAGGYSAGNAARFGLETTRPLIVARAGTKREESRPLLTCSTPDVLVETVKPSSDGKALIVRLFGVSGKSRSTRLNWQTVQPTSISLTDLTERPLRKIGRSVEVPAYAVIHLRAELPAVGGKPHPAVVPSR